MDHREPERFIAHMAEMRLRVPEWCKAEHMEISLPQKELRRYGTNDHSNMMERIIHWINGRQKRREATS